MARALEGWTFFKATNTGYLNWFLSELPSGVSKRSFKHFSIIGADEIVDIIADTEPSVKFTDINIF